jgi:Tfp pilus assembly protein PilN
VLEPVRALFVASGYLEEARLTDYVLEGSALRSRAARVEGFVIPITIDDLAANDLLEVLPQACWERSIETLTARKDDLAGIAIASEDRIEAYILYLKPAEIVSLRSFVDDGGARLTQLLARLGAGTLRFPKVHPAEISNGLLTTLGFQAADAHRVYATRAQSA